MFDQRFTNGCQSLNAILQSAYLTIWCVRWLDRHVSTMFQPVSHLLNQKSLSIHFFIKMPALHNIYYTSHTKEISIHVLRSTSLVKQSVPLICLFPLGLSFPKQEVKIIVLCLAHTHLVNWAWIQHAEATDLVSLIWYSCLKYSCL